MIGGTDPVINGTMPQDADLILWTMRNEWPDGLVQAGDSPEALPFRSIRFPIKGPVEFIIYRDAAAFDSWRVGGAKRENQETMMHLLVGPDSITMVVDRENSPLASLAHEVLESLTKNRRLPAG